MSRPNSMRKKLYVDRIVQGTILRHIVVQWGLFLMATFVLLLFFDVVAGVQGNDGENLFQRNGLTMLAILALAPIFIYDLCKLSNRFVGPMARLRRAMHDLANGGEVSKIQFRKRDFWQEMAEDFNRIAQRVQSTGTTLPDDTNSDDVRALETVEST